jgi:hypothetical protein
MIGSTLDQIRAEMVPDFIRLDQQTNGSVAVRVLLWPIDSEIDRGTQIGTSTSRHDKGS